MNAKECRILYVEARNEGYDHWESIWFVICDATR
jgi:hypothetical protein